MQLNCREVMPSGLHSSVTLVTFLAQDWKLQVEGFPRSFTLLTINPFQQTTDAGSTGKGLWLHQNAYQDAEEPTAVV